MIANGQIVNVRDLIEGKDVAMIVCDNAEKCQDIPNTVKYGIFKRPTVGSISVIPQIRTDERGKKMPTLCWCFKKIQSSY